VFNKEQISQPPWIFKFQGNLS